MTTIDSKSHAEPGAAPTQMHVSEATVTEAIDRAIDWLEKDQRPDGSWVGMLESNCCMEAQWILAQHILGIEDDLKMSGVVQAILNKQRIDGSWEIYYDAPQGDINTTVECYVALRAQGHDPGSDYMTKAREWIADHGGLPGVRVFTRYWLAMVGLWRWEKTPAMPPELIFLPVWAPMNIYRFSSWARATILPLAILSARRPVKPLPEGRVPTELFPAGRNKLDDRLCKDKWLPSVATGFRVLDRLLAAYVKSPVHPGRELAITQCIEWIVRHQDADGSWGGIQPPWIYALIALHHEGFALDHPVLKRGLDAFNESWSYQRDGGTFLQASDSIVWDTMLSSMALLDCGRTVDDCSALSRGLEWLLSKQNFAPGDWQLTVKGVAPGGWSFERANAAYPDVDDTAVAMIVLARARDQMPDPERVDRSLKLAADWVRAMQSRNGGWGAFDKDNDSELVTKIPFCDFGEVLDPPSVDLAGHCIEAFAEIGCDTSDPAVMHGLDYIWREQESDGSWFGRWGVNHIYGTAAVLPALAAIGHDMTDKRCVRAANWIVDHQNADGGWGESCASYMNPKMRGKGPSTASQTGWALMCLHAMHSPAYDEAIDRGLAYLLHTQRDDGTWDEPYYTGTGFPGYGVGERLELDDAVEQRLDQGAELSRGFMINYNMYRHYFPLMAMGRIRAARSR